MLHRIFLNSAEVVPCLSLVLDYKEILFHRLSYSKQISKRQRQSFSYLISVYEPMQTSRANNRLLLLSITLTCKSMEDDLGIWDLVAWKISCLGFWMQTIFIQPTGGRLLRLRIFSRSLVDGDISDKLSST